MNRVYKLRCINKWHEIYVIDQRVLFFWCRELKQFGAGSEKEMSRIVYDMKQGNKK